MSSDNSVEVIGLDVQITSPDISRIFVSETDPDDGSRTINDNEDVWIEAAGNGLDGGSGGSGGSAVETLESEMHIATNEHRESQGLSPLSYRDDVATVARNHSQNMYEQDNLSHTLDGQGAGDRLDEAGISWTSVAENIGYETHDSVGGDPTQSELETIAQSFIDNFVDSPGHRENIESDNDAEGVGVYIDETNNIVWATAVFITP